MLYQGKTCLKMVDGLVHVDTEYGALLYVGKVKNMLIEQATLCSRRDNYE